METMQPVLKRVLNSWNQSNMPEAEFQGRIKKIKEAMVERNIDVLLVYGSGNNEYGNPCYLSNSLMQTPKGGVLVAIPQKGEVALIPEASSRDLPDIKRITWIEDIRPCGDISRECIKYLNDKNLVLSTIGLVGLRQLMPYNQWQYFQESVKQSKTVDSDHIIRDIRMLKSQRECGQIRRSSRILSHAFKFISDTLFHDMNERIMEAIVDREARLEGIEDFRMMVAKPLEDKWAFRPAENRQMLPGETVIIYLAAGYERYWSEGIRTFVVENNRLMQPEFENAEALYKRIMDGMKPGKTLSQFYRETIGELQGSNFDYILEYGLGQGVGLSLQEFPIISEEDVTELKEGMSLTLRLVVQDRAVGVIMTGHTICLAKDGIEVLTK
ncbi:M24 family metallopeptidase [Chloroflexota bacterium]